MNASSRAAVAAVTGVGVSLLGVSLGGLAGMDERLQAAERASAPAMEDVRFDLRRDCPERHDRAAPARQRL